MVKQLVELLSVTNGPTEKLNRDVINQAEFVFKEKKTRSGEDSSLTVLNEKNVKTCMDLIRSLKNNNQFQLFFEVLDEAKLKFYGTSMTVYLARTRGVPPTDFTTILKNLKNVKDEDSPYQNKVSNFFQDVVNVVSNFNLPRLRFCFVCRHLLFCLDFQGTQRVQVQPTDQSSLPKCSALGPTNPKNLYQNASEKSCPSRFCQIHCVLHVRKRFPCPFSIYVNATTQCFDPRRRHL